MSNVANRPAAVPAGTSGTSGIGIASLVLGIVGIFFAQIILGPLAIIFGAIGWFRANRAGRGRGVPIAGTVLGIIDVILFAALFAAASRNGFVWHI